MDIATAYRTAPAVGSLVQIPADLATPVTRHFVGSFGIVQSVIRDVRSGRVVMVSCAWFTEDFRPTFRAPVPVGQLVDWAPPVR